MSKPRFELPYIAAPVPPASAAKADFDLKRAPKLSKSYSPEAQFDLREWYIDQLSDPDVDMRHKVALATKLADFEWAKPGTEKVGKKDQQASHARHVAATGTLASLVN